MKTLIVMILLPILSFAASYAVCTHPADAAQIHARPKDCDGGTIQSLDGWNCSDWKPIRNPVDQHYLGIKPGGG